MEFVVHVLQKFFKKSATEAAVVNVEHDVGGFGVAAIYTRDVAETQVSRVTEYAKQHGHPLRVTAEPEGFDE
jgi:ATP-dependent Clp protease adaptor protein ClpS